MVKEEAEQKQKEIDDWNKMVVVENTHFKVNTRVNKSHQMNKFKSIREGGVHKIGYRLSGNRANTMNARQIYLNKLPVIPPVSMLGLHEEYKMNEG
jgi:hypothetical protein